MATLREAHRASTVQSSRRDSIKVETLKPLKRKLDRIETERIYRAVQASLWKLKQAEVLSWFIEDDAHLFRITDVGMRETVLNHQQLAKYRIPGDKDGEERLKESVRAILRCCSQNSLLLSSYKPDDEEQIISEENIRLSRYFEEMKEMMLARLLTESKEENARWKYLLQTMEKGRHAQNAIVQLRQTLKEKITEKESIVSAKEREILHLKQTLEAMEMRVEDDNNATLNDAAKQILSTQRSLETKHTKIRQEIISLNDTNVKARRENYNKESKLRKRKFKLAGELQNWILKYDQDMGWRQEEVDELTELNLRDLEDIKELEGHFVDLQNEYDAVIEERRAIAEEKRQREEKEREELEASIKIQALWRGWEARQSIQKPKKNKKGGKGAKGEKKKKK